MNSRFISPAIKRKIIYFVQHSDWVPACPYTKIGLLNIVALSYCCPEDQQQLNVPTRTYGPQYTPRFIGSNRCPG